MQKVAKRAADGWIEPKQAAFCNNINDGFDQSGQASYWRTQARQPDHKDQVGGHCPGISASEALSLSGKFPEK
jgi:hypothetical protein